MTNPVPLEYGQYYHIYNRGNNRENLFVEDRNYRYLLRLYAQHIEPIANTLGRAASALFNAYAKAFNNTSDRTGSLFERPFGRVRVTSNAYIVWLVVYIHQNPQKHGILPDFRDWPYSSFHAHLSPQATRLKRDEVLAWFDGEAGFVPAHEQRFPERRIAALVPDDSN
jgi:putative transposase